MNDTVQIALIIAVAIIVVLIVFRERLSRFIFKVGKGGIETELEAKKKTIQPKQKGGTHITQNKQIGKGNIIDVGMSPTNVDDNLQLGEDNKVIARPNKAKGK